MIINLIDLATIKGVNTHIKHTNNMLGHKEVNSVWIWNNGEKTHSKANGDYNNNNSHYSPANVVVEMFDSSIKNKIPYAFK